MNRIIITSCFAILLCLCFGPVVQAQTCENNYIGPSGGIWQLDTNWDLSHDPMSSEVACIPAGVTVVVDQQSSPTDVQAEAIVIYASAGSRLGKVTMESETTLTLYSNSTIDGTLEMNERCELRIAANLTITGDGGDILGLPPGSGPVAIIVAASGSPNAVLTLAGSNNSSRSTSLTTHGQLDLRVRVANTAYVVADDATLLLSTNTKSGSGFWIAETPGGNDAGLLDVSVEVQGPGKWVLESNSSAKIQIHADCPSLSGDLELSNGSFEVDGAEFTTTGNIRFKSVGSTPTQPRMNLKNGGVAHFGS